MSKLLDAVKLVSSQTQNAGDPAAVMFGVVASVAPLTVTVDNRFAISGDMIIIPKELTSGTAVNHSHTVSAHKHTLPDTTEDTGEVGLTTGGGSYYGLAVGEKVILLRNAGGQQFVILGRV